MDYQTILENIRNRAAKNPPLGDTVKFDLEGQPVFIDGTGNENLVTEQDGEAKCTISVSMENMGKMMRGELNPMMAAMTGKMKIKGDMGLAMKLQALI